MEDPEVKETFRSSMFSSNSNNNTTRSSNTSNNNLIKSSNNNLSKSNAAAAAATVTQSNTNNTNNLLADNECELLGIGFFTIWEVGLLVVSGTIGTGIVLSRNVLSGKWSGPAAVQITGIGVGLLIGGSSRQIVYLIYDYFTLESISNNGGLILGLTAEVTTCGTTWTQSKSKSSNNVSIITSFKTLQSSGLGSNISLSLGINGLFCSLSLEGAICNSRNKLNSNYYHNSNNNNNNNNNNMISASEILLSGKQINEIRKNNNDNNDTNTNCAIGGGSGSGDDIMDGIYTKLNILCSSSNSSSSDNNDDDGNTKNKNNNNNKTDGSSATVIKESTTITAITTNDG
jgi:lipid-binding SYLF domain-containing protein